jgi:hypothetical protein
LQLACFGAVLGHRPLEGPDASPTVLAAVFCFARWANLGPDPGLVPRHTRLHHGVHTAAGEAVPDGSRDGDGVSRHCRSALQLRPRLVQRRSFETRRLFARGVPQRASAASPDVAGAWLHQLTGGAGPIAHADCGRQAARRGYGPLQGRDVQLQPHAPGDVLASWGCGGVVEGVESPPDPEGPKRG